MANVSADRYGRRTPPAQAASSVKRMELVGARPQPQELTGIPGLLCVLTARLTPPCAWE